MIHELIIIGNNSIIQITNKMQKMCGRQNKRPLLQREEIKNSGTKAQFQFKAYFSILKSNNL